MTWKDIKPGTTVYHCVFVHWGRGVVRKVVPTDPLTRLFEKGNRRILVEFEGREKHLATMTLRELRATPNRRKIREMVAIYQRRGVNAVDGGDVLILPAKKEEP